VLFLVHGEDEVIAALRNEVIEGGMAERLVIAPELDDEMELLAEGPAPRPLPVLRRLLLEVSGRPDWLNDLAQFTLDLREAFERAADDRSRGILIRRLRRALNAESGDGEADTHGS
jgi:metallo-beta-lactamase family protein